MSATVVPLEPAENASSPSAKSAAALPRPRRGRPPGKKSAVMAAEQVLGLHHFHFMRAALELPLRTAWERYLAFAGGLDDERHFAAQRRRLAQQIRTAAEQRGLQRLAEKGLYGCESAAPPSPPLPALSAAPAPALPSLDSWIEERCAVLGVDADFQSQAEWFAEYKEEFALDLQSIPLPATALPAAEAPRPAAKEAPALKEQLQALHQLALEIARPPELQDTLATWLAPGLCRALSSKGVLTLGNLIDFLNLNHHRWYERVRGIGRDRAERLRDWLAPVAEQLGRPLGPEVLHSRTSLVLARRGALATLEPVSLRRFGIVPLERLAVPPELAGRSGGFRLAQANVFGAENDLDAIQAWLQRYVMSPRTFEAYGREVERFYLWCLREARKPLSAVVESDLHAYREFMRQPPADWVQTRKVDRGSEAWRPFRGALSPASQRRALTVISAMFSALVEGGYLSANAVKGVLPFVKLPRSGINIRRAFTEQQWGWIMGTLAEQPDSAFTRRTRLVLELGVTSGLRLIEMATARIGALRQEVLDGQLYWLLDVVGKGNRNRRVLIQDDIKELIDGHQADMDAAGIGFMPSASRLRTLLSSPSATQGEALQQEGANAPAEFDPGMRPLIGALRPTPPRWKLDANGVKVLDREPARQSDQYGALEPSALYQSLKRLFAQAAKRAEARGASGAVGKGKRHAEIDAEELKRASTHWLRHTFANNAAADGVLPVALMGAMGHADLRTTSIYTRAEERLMVSELSKVRRRG